MSKLDDLIGTPFINHGRDTVKGLDCYGLVMEVFRRFGKPIPEYNADWDDANKISEIIHEQAHSHTWKACHPPSLPVPCVVALRYGTPPGVINHTGVYIGDGKFIHTRANIGVCIERISSPAWQHLIEGYYELME